MEELLLENGFKVESGPSAWEILSLQKEVLLAKLGFFKKAMAEFIGTDTPQWKAFQRWLDKKYYEILNQKLSLYVPHRDFLATIL